MLTIKPIEKKDDQRTLCGVCGAEYCADYFAYAAYDDEKFIGICQFGMGDGVGHIYDISHAPDTDDFESLFLLGRAALNFIDLCGVADAYFEGEEGRLSKAVGFKRTDDGKLYMDLRGFFTDHDKHSQK